MTTSTLITLIVAVLGSGGLATIITALVNSRRNKSQSETEARAQKTDEFRAIINAHRDQISDLRKDVESLKSEMVGWRSRYEDSEQYIDVIIAGVYEGRYPPFPARN